MSRGPLFIHISPDWCGQEKLADLFRLNGHETIFAGNGSTAEHILFAQANDEAPPREWADATLITGLSRHKPHWRPPLEAWRSFTWLERHFPDAYFILTTRDLDGWLLDRLIRDDSAVARCHAYHHNLPEIELPQLWETGWHAHTAAVEAHFGDDPRLIRINLETETPQDVAKRLSALLPMAKLQSDPDWQPPYETTPGNALETSFNRALFKPELDAAFAEEVAAFCLRDVKPEPGPVPEMSGYSFNWDGDRGITMPNGTQRRVTVTSQPGSGRVAISPPGRAFKVRRSEGVLNDILRLNRATPLLIDMEDSRWLGSPQGTPAHQPVLCHNRRNDARNVVLWPLPDQHSVGLPGFDPCAAPDLIPFDQKRDRLVWRGMISGSEMRDSVRPGPASHVFLRQLDQAGDDPEAREIAWQGLSRTSRMNFILRYFGHPDFDIGIVMAWAFMKFAADPFIAPYCVRRENLPFFRRFRYQICLTGYDHGSNFITMIDSQSVMLKEEDGWEVFYSGCFEPWKHYIPIARYCTDIEEKLAWARANPNECKAMSAAARAQVARLRDPLTRRAIMAHILDGLAASR